MIKMETIIDILSINLNKKIISYYLIKPVSVKPGIQVSPLTGRSWIIKQVQLL